MLAGLHGHCQHQRVWGIVKDDKGNAIPACTVHATKGGGVAVTDRHGSFLLVTTLPDSVEFYSLGYAKKKIAITGDTMNIVLPQQIATIDEVNVSADHQRRKTKTAIMGKKNLKPYGMFSGFTGNETAIFLKADSSKHGTLNEIFFYILKDGLPNAKFRVHVYDIDTSYLPGQDLLDTTVIASATTGDEWVRVDVSRWHVPVGRGVFISFQTIFFDVQQGKTRCQLGLSGFGRFAEAQCAEPNGIRYLHLLQVARIPTIGYGLFAYHLSHTIEHHFGHRPCMCWHHAVSGTLQVPEPLHLVHWSQALHSGQTA